ncbi:hypothetical protein BV898_19663 [Hypsibius exemplaris]|uniref:G-protein coupled receptors family 1 profile domain-containing protein n=1 Tax=Hypsibius exemplaris TaxID=2072580 RepID=A0A9X6NK29_HYPEX|nr:hypothetical protein BV898_19663 [Hypsibius exemplaris]
MNFVKSWQTRNWRSRCQASSSVRFTNLIVFKLWRNPDPNVFFHISVALSSLLAGISLLSGNFLPYQNFTPLAIWLTKLLGVVLLYFADCSALFAIFCISIDRWLSVKYPAKYRSHVLRQKILFVIIVPIWTGSTLIVSAGTIRYWDDLFIAPCSYCKLFVPQGAAYTVWSFVKGPIVLPFLFISQLRILIIGSSLKLRLWRGRAISASVAIQESCYSPLVYVALFPQYRAVLMQASRSLRRHIFDQWSIDASAEPAHQAQPSSRLDVCSHSV